MHVLVTGIVEHCKSLWWQPHRQATDLLPEQLSRWYYNDCQLNALTILAIAIVQVANKIMCLT